MTDVLTASNDQQAVFQFLSGGGEMGQLIREYDWSKTSLGPIDTWPHSLRTCIRIMLDSRQPIWIGWGKEWVKLYNDPYLSIIGGKHPWALGKPASVVWKDIWGDIAPMLDQVKAGKGTYVESQLLIMERNGYPEETYYTFSYTPVPGDDGSIAGMFCANTDDTDRIVSERQLKTFTGLGKALIDCRTEQEVIENSMAILCKNPHDFPFALFYTVAANKAILTSATPLGDAQANVPAVIDFDITNEITQLLNQAVATQKMQVFEGVQQKLGMMPKGIWEVSPDKTIILPVLRKPTKEAYGFLVVGLNPYRLLDEKYRSFFSLIADQVATALANVQAQEQERKRAESLAEIDRAKTAFFTNISHEFRTPLTLMLGSLEALMNKKGNEAISTTLETTHRNALRLLKLVNNLLDFSRLEAGKVKPKYQLTDIAQFTTDLASSFRSAIEAAGLSFHVYADAGVQPVYIDKEMWEQIVLNLLSNAFKYTLQGSITVSLQAQDELIVLKVGDTGVGIPEAALPKMFERFHRVENTAGRSYEGTGIGLSLVKELVRLHDGEISISSKEGAGSTFTVTIPAGKQHVAAANAVEISTGPRAAIAEAFIEEAVGLMPQLVATNRKATNTDLPTVLVVDDNADMRSYISGLLHDRFNIVAAVNGKDALQLLKEEKVDLILSDIMMPVMDGIQLLKAIKDNPQTTALPVILVSARAGEESKIEGFDIGADDYLVKPFSARELLARVQAQVAIARKRATALQDVYRMFDEVPFAITALKGPDLVIEYINQYNLDIWQQTKDEVLGKALFEVRPDMHASAGPIHAQIYQSGQRFQASEVPIEMDIKGKVETRFFNFIVDPIKNERGEITGQLATSIDVTEQVLARKKVEESEKEMQRIFKQAPVAINVFEGKDFIIKSVNDLQLKRWGRTEAELLDKPLFDAIPEIRGQGFEEMLTGVLETGTSVAYYEKRADTIRDGKPATIYTDAHFQPWFNEHGKVKGVIAIATDVTDKVTARQEIELSREQLRLVTDAMPVLISYVDKEERYQFCNKGYEQWFGHPTAEMIGKTIRDMVGEKAYTVLQPYTSRALSGEPVSYEAKVPYKDGGERYIHASLIPHFEADKKVLGYYALVTDITAQKEAEAALIESEERFRSMADASPNMVWTLDEAGNSTYYNRQAKAFTGHAEEDLQQGKSWQVAIHPDDIDYATGVVTNAVTNRVPYQMECRMMRADGQWRWLLSHGTPRFGGNGEYYGFVGSSIDITERKLIERQIRESEQRFQNLVREANVGIILLTGPEMKVEIVNNAYGKLIERTTEELLGKELFSVIPAAEAYYRPLLEKVLYGGEPHYIYDSFYSVEKEGKKIEGYLNVVYQPYRDAEGQVVGVLTLCQDVSASVRAKKELEESELRFRTLAETLPQMIWMRRLDGAMEYASENWEKYSGIKDIREAWRTMTHPEDWSNVMGVWEQALKTNKAFNYEVRLKNRHGEYRWHNASGVPVKDEQGNVVKWLGALTDIQEQKTFSEKLEQQVAERTKELHRSNEDLQQFAHVASHDLKEPVRKVMTFSNRLRDSLGTRAPEEANTYLTKIERSAMRMYAMIDGVLLYSSLDALEQAKELIDINELMESITADLEVPIQQKGAQIQYGSLLQVRGSSVLMYQLFYNLVNNALKFASADVAPLIELFTTLAADEEVGAAGLMNQGPYIKIMLRDNGIGFDNKDAERIFSTFTRLHSKDQYEGTGLGLALCRKIVERHGGIIKAEGKLGAGACFTMLLPAA